MKTRTITLTICTVVALTGLTATAFAQDAAPPPASTNTAPVTRTGRTSGDIANGGLGVGATMYTSGLFGPEVVYDFGLWHLEGMLGFDHRPNGGGGNAPTLTTFDFGVGGWYHLHLGENSDFSLGAAFGLLTESPSVGNSATGFEFEPGAQVRAFITPNVALHGGLGFVFAFGDYVPPLSKQISLAGQVNADFGFTYYFR
jgi:hypothetical protein